jgi:predicted ArsR family transcriptional regulator
MKKVGPLSSDLVVACKIYEYQKDHDRVEFAKLVEGLEGLVSKSTILNALATLSDWGIIKTEFGETEAGRAGRLYYVSGEAEAMIRETYEKYWDRILAEKK